MHYWLNQSKKIDEILQRPDISDEEFLNRLQLSGESAKKIVNCCRMELGIALRVPPEKLYPNDIFRDIINLSNWQWDMAEILIFLEKHLGIEIDEQQFPNWTSKGTTLGKWIVQFLVILRQS